MPCYAVFWEHQRLKLPVLQCFPRSVWCRKAFSDLAEQSKERMGRCCQRNTRIFKYQFKCHKNVLEA
eukprot:613864-Amphidinium_carterae.1